MIALINKSYFRLLLSTILLIKFIHIRKSGGCCVKSVSRWYDGEEVNDDDVDVNDETMINCYLMTNRSTLFTSNLWEPVNTCDYYYNYSRSLLLLIDY